MSDTVKNALSAIETRLQAILVASGYNTDAGNQVYLGRRYFVGENTVYPLLTIFTGSEDPSGEGALGGYDLSRDIIIEGYVDDASTPTVSLENLIEDIQQALEQSDITLGGVVDSLDYAGLEAPEPPNDGSSIATVQVNYRIGYQRAYGA